MDFVNEQQGGQYSEYQQAELRILKKNTFVNHPTGEWMVQVARNLTGFDGELVLANARYLIRE